MVKFEIDVQGLEEAAEAFEDFGKRVAQPAEPLLRRIGNDWIKRVFRRHFDDAVDGDGKPWAPRSAVGQKIRPSGRTLFDRGELLQSIRIIRADEETLEVGSTLLRAKLLQFGGFTAGKSAIPAKRIPARPFIELGPRDVDQTFQEVEDYYFGPE